MIGFSSVASNVIAPSNTKTGIAENTHPFPRKQVKTIYKILIFCISGFPLQPFAKPLKPFFDIDHFSDQSALTRYFRTHVGMSPQQYRLK